MVLLFLSKLSVLESDSKAEVLQRLVVSSSLNKIAAATGLPHTGWLPDQIRYTYETGENPR
jgi:hypothetical protein